MASEAFRAMLQGDFFPSDGQPDALLISLAEDYHRETEAYDRTICTGPIRDGCILPATDYEYRMIARNAYTTLQAKTKIAEANGFSPKALQKAIQQAEQAGPPTL